MYDLFRLDLFHLPELQSFYGYIIFHCLDIPYVVHQPAEHMGCLHDLSVMRNVTPNTLRQVFVWTYVFASRRCILRNRISGSDE